MSSSVQVSVSPYIVVARLSNRLAPAFITRVRAARGFIFDMDGTLIVGNEHAEGFVPLPGAIETLQALTANNVPFLVFTNGTGKTPAAYAASLRAVGLPVPDQQMMTPASSAAAWFVAKGIRRVRVLGGEGIASPFRTAGLIPVSADAQNEAVEALFTGQFREFMVTHLEIATNDIWSGALPTSASNVPFFAAKGGRAIGTSFAITAALTAITGKRARILGKPSRDALWLAIRALGLPRAAAHEVVVVGDDPALEMAMARSGGAMSIGLTAGLTTAEGFSKQPPSRQADAVLPDLMALAELWS